MKKPNSLKCDSLTDYQADYQTDSVTDATTTSEATAYKKVDSCVTLLSPACSLLLVDFSPKTEEFLQICFENCNRPRSGCHLTDNMI